MASRYFKKGWNPFSRTAILLHQKKLIEDRYGFFKLRMEKGVLVCRAEIRSEDYRNIYKIEIRCVVGNEPCSKIVEPADIVPSLKIHMYGDHSLCLHYPPDLEWNARTPIYRYTVPWVIEWITFYELYLTNGGIWKGRESPAHFTEADKNISEDVFGE